jgi:outer membrane protein insertion porin family
VTARLPHLALAATLALGCAATPPPPAPAPPVVTAAPALAAPPPEATSPLGAPLPSFTGLVARIDVRGAPAPEVALRALATRLGEPFDPARIQDDLRALWALQLFEDVAVEAEPHPSGVTLTYVVVMRPPIDHVSFAGTHQIPEAELAALVADLRGAPANPALIDDAVRRVQARYAELGHRLSRVETEQGRIGAGGVELRFVIDEGPRVVIGTWTFTGNVKVSTAELRKQMASGASNAAGGLYSEELWERDVMRISAAYFDRGMLQVRVGPIELIPSADGSVLTATVPIVEGAVFHLGTVAVTDPGAPAGVRHPTGVVRVKRGEVFDRNRIKGDIDRLRAWFARELRRKVEVNPLTELDVAGAKVNVVFRVEDALP